MHNRAKQFLTLLLIAIFSVASYTSGYSQKSKKGTKNRKASMEKIFGIRGDVPLSKYQKVAANKAPYNTAEYPDFSSAVGFSFSFDGSEYPESGATGVLINENWILTVGHNFFDKSQDDGPVPPEGIFVILGNDINNLKTKYAVEKLVLHPTWKEGTQEFYDGNDICLVKLKEPITSVKPVPLVSNKEEPLGATVWLSGFGDFSQIYNKRKFSDKHSVENILDRKTDTILTSKNGTEYGVGMLATDFDSPLENANSFDKENNDPEIVGAFGKGVSTKVPTNFEGTSVPGDSGGPLYIKIDGEWKVCGVLSATLSGFPSKNATKDSDVGYGAITLYTRIASHLKWIQNTLSAQ